ncbi:MAG: transglycosylase SLT domain-containing protein [Phaeospirillum sp.]|nr:transglycosylase SLT domain-containing protein [Phaeospirillum sp.]
MFDDFAITAFALRLAYGIVAVIGIIWLSSHLDQRAKRSFGDSMEEMAKDPIALALYYGLRFVGLALLLGMLMGCSAASAGTVIPSRYDAEISSAVKTYWPDYPAPAAWKAQLYQESRLDPSAVSPVGTAGLAQIMPGTWGDLTRELRLGNASPHAAIAIEAGAYYMAKLRRGWRSERAAGDRNQLAQASYNAGMGHIVKAQGLCGGARLWAGIAPCLPQVTGIHARETTTYVERIHRYRAMLEAGL